MYNFIRSLLNAICNTIFRKRKNLIFTVLLLKKENEIYERHLYLLMILEIKSRRIIKWSLTKYPSREFVRQQVIDVTYDDKDSKILIYDNAPQFTSINYSDYGITGANISFASPNMNSFVERVNGTIRREALDHFLLLSEKQVRNIILEYVEYYNNQRFHQGIDKISNAEIQEQSGAIHKMIILSGLHHHYYCSSA